MQNGWYAYRSVFLWRQHGLSLVHENRTINVKQFSASEGRIMDIGKDIFFELWGHDGCLLKIDLWRSIMVLNYSVDGDATGTWDFVINLILDNTGTRPIPECFLVIPTQSEASRESGRIRTCGVLCNTHGKVTPHCSKRSRRLIRRRVLARYAGSWGFSWARSKGCNLFVLIDVIMVTNWRSSWCFTVP